MFLPLKILHGFPDSTHWEQDATAMNGRSSDSVIALFSGAGGMSLGFTQAGHRPKASADIDEDACSTYRANIGSDVFRVDLSGPVEDFSKALARHTNAFALIGGPPCQGFSSAGLKDGHDKRNRLIFNYFSIVERVRPRWFLFENVEGLLTAERGRSVSDLVREFIRIGYRTRLEKVNFAAYGLPQARKRVILVGNRLGLDFELPTARFSFNAGKHKCGGLLPAAPTLDEALAGLGTPGTALDDVTAYATTKPVTKYDALMRADNSLDKVRLHFATVSPQLVPLLASLRPGETMKDLPEEYWHDSFKRRAFRRVADGTPTENRGGAPCGVKRLIGDLNALTITSAATREFIHPRDDRPLTLREAARLQSFPDEFNFVGGRMSVGRQIGNAFPPMAARVLAEHLAYLDGSFGGSRGPRQSGNTGALIGFRLTDSSGKSPALANTEILLESLRTEQHSFPFEPLTEVA
jgi:DNA (cytosine-5)-methyltransferase 1